MLLTACQSMPQAYNGITGYQVEQKDAQSARLSYTLAARNQQVNEQKLQKACKQVLGKQYDYRIQVIEQREILNPQTSQPMKQGVQVGKSSVSVGLMDLQNTGDYAARQALDVRPSTLTVVRYQCYIL
ncbi:MAG: hypothetical protein Q4D05_08355 [Acinetobacter sp.]|nr:hypothetical protein [Acinetobacter sp.]